MDGSLSADFPVVRISWQVLRKDKKIMLIALLETISIVLTLGITVACAGLWEEWGEVLIYPLAVLAGLVLAVFLTFFSVALMRYALVRFQDGTPTLRDGLKISLSHLPLFLALLIWVAKLSLVEFLQRFSERKARSIGELVGVTPEILGATCGVLSRMNYFLLPVLVAEGGPPIQAIMRSALLSRKTEGWPPLANAIGNEAIMVLLAAIPGPAMFAGGGLLAHETDAVIFKVICLLGAALIVAMFTLMIALNGVCSAAMYQHVALREIESECDQKALEVAHGNSEAE